MSVLTDPSTYPISAAAARQLDRTLFGHVIDGVLADDVWARYGNADLLNGADALASWIAEWDATVVWQHHLLSVYHVDVDGDRAAALVYHTSHQVFEDDPETAKLIVGRYHCELRREPGGWRISRLVLEVLWAEDKTDPTGYLALIGGRGPQG